jgi:flagellar P-ring protein precursor FlgI
MRFRVVTFTIIAALLLGMLPARASVRLKDIADFEGARDNLLVGYGLVMGLNGTGDDLTRDLFTRESLIGMLERLGVNARDVALSLRTKNIAAVMVTATMPSIARTGTRIDITVSAMGDATNLTGGTLIVTPLLGADGQVYAVGQGDVSVAGYTARAAAATVTRGVPTAGRIPNGAIVEREVGIDFAHMQTMNISLRNPDFTTARRVADVINAHLRDQSAKAIDEGTIRIALNDYARADMVGLITGLEQLRIEPDQVAKVIIDEAEGVIVMGENVRISTVAVAQGNITVKITETPEVSQPGALAPGPAANGQGGARTTVVPRSNIQVDENANRRLAVVPPSVTIQQLVASLNALGLGPRDMIAILQGIKAAGAMQADLEVR